jgi:hypothetical protein
MGNFYFTDHEGGELVFNDDGKRFGVEHELGVGIIHLGSMHHQVLDSLQTSLV